MKNNYVNLVWGLALIGAGILFMASNFGLLSAVTPLFWTIFFAGLSLLGFACYFLSGMRQWWWLFPGFISAGLALTISLSSAGVNGSWVGTPILASIALPFLAVYLTDRRNWWALIPAWIMGVLSVVTLVADRVQGEVIGTLVLFSFAVPFLAVYLYNRANWWALIPAGVFGVIGVIPLLSTQVSGDVMGALVMFLFSLPFFVVYFWSSGNWWALIPAGVFASIGLMVLVAGGPESGFAKASLITGVMFLGWALTFLALWLRRASHPTDWAKYPAMALGAMALVSIVLGVASLQYIWPLVIIAAGTLLLYTALRPKRI